MGFDKDFIQTEKVCVKNNLVCPICLELLEDPKDLKGCQHTFCHRCISLWIGKFGFDAECPVCRHGIKSISDVVETHRFIRNALSEIEFKCSFGCGKVVSHEKYRKHIQFCQDNPSNFIECICKLKLQRYKLDAHQDSCVAHLKQKLVSLFLKNLLII